MTEELKRHKNYVWGLQDLNDQFHPHKMYHTDHAVISILQDIRDAILEYGIAQRPVASKKSWWKRWR